MTVEQLRELLVGFNKESRVLIASDEEGNNFADISNEVAVDMVKNGTRELITLYPSNCIDNDELLKIIKEV